MAWSEDPPNQNYNPFKRMKSRTNSNLSRTDVERGLRQPTFDRTDTEKGLRSQALNQPTQPNGMPISSLNDNNPGTLDDGEKRTHEQESTDTSDTVVADCNPAGSQTRKRRFLGIGKKQEENFGPARTESSDTSKIKKKFTFWSQIQNTLFNSWINILLLAVPIGIIVKYLHIAPVGIFVVNFIAIIPLAALLSYATEEIALRVGETLGGLLNATFGNAVELIVSILALVKNEVLIVQTSLIGSILSNLLLVMGMCFFFGGINRKEQFFNITVAQTAASLLALAVGSLIIPTAFHQFSTAGDSGIAPLSRGTAIILLIVYGCYLYFQLKTHADMYNEPSKKVPSRKAALEEGAASNMMAQVGGNLSANAGGQLAQENPVQQPEEEKEEPQLSIWTAVITLGVSTALVALCAEYLVSSIDALTATGGISKTFVGLILLPIVGNAAEHATALTVACKDKMDLAIGVAVGSSMQIALLVIPFVVTLGWILGNDAMTLQFDGFQIAILFVAVILVNYIIQDGKSHWLEGVLLQATYLIIAVAAWFYPANGTVA
ncbi:MAG: hypothetical protein M1827_002211 [Pycnora praestabilis]|nr:MAG: hypothetical protein M1827_002211 [Pycnora praestabilis]